MIRPLQTWMLAIVLLGANCSPNSGDSQKISQSPGRIDLSLLEFDSVKVIHLKGDYYFFWEKWIDPTTKIISEALSPIPGLWQSGNGSYSGDDLSIHGFATYSFELILPHSTDSLDRKYGIILPDITSSYRLYANGLLIQENGVIGKTRDESLPFIRTRYVQLPPGNIHANTQSYWFVFHVSNYENTNPGFWGFPKVGTWDAVVHDQKLTSARELFLMGAMTILALYHLGLFFYRQKETSIFYFALFCLLMAVRIFVTGDRFVYEFVPEDNWLLVFRIEFLSFYLSVPILFTFVAEIFQERISTRFKNLILISLYCFVLTLVLPTHLYTLGAIYFQYLTVISALLIFYITGVSLVKGYQGSRSFLLGLGILISTGIWDVFQDRLNYRGIALIPYGLLWFVFSQAIILSSRLSKAFQKTEDLSISLMHSNEELTALKENLESLVVNRTQELNDSISVIKKDLQLAKKIQRQLLPSSQIRLPNYHFESRFIPEEEVGGDIFDIHEIRENYYRIFLADAMGHGVQAALLTMAIKSEYEEHKLKSRDPGSCLEDLSEGFKNKFSSLSTFFSCIVLDIDIRRNRIVYSSAGHPDQLIFRAQKSIGENTIITLKRSLPILGMIWPKKHELQKIEIYPGDRVYLYSDGLVEAMNSKREIYGEERLFQSLHNTTHLKIEEQLDYMIRDLSQFIGQPKFQDDLTIVSFERMR